MSVLAVINPAGGDRSAVQFFNTHVFDKLKPDATTTEPNAALRIASAASPVTVVLGSGDGTLHEIINDLPDTEVNFVLVPCGTANALYASLFPTTGDDSPNYKLQSLQAFLDGRPPIHLSLATTNISAPSHPLKSSLASVVVSTSLHASILHDSEALRDQHPGVERFKIAAQQNSTKWYKSTVKLSGNVQIYDRKSKAFLSHGDSTLEGPFAYFLSTVNVDRLEPTFRIAPLVRTIPSAVPACDIVVVRPLRDPSISKDTPETRTSFVANTWKILTAAYQDGAHVDLGYIESGELTSDGQGVAAVEYFRCAGWEWIPNPADADAHLVCNDGAISTIPSQGKVTCAVDTFKHRYSVYG